MWHESAKQMETLFEGAKITTTITGLKLLAENQDKNFHSLEKKLIEVLDLLKSDKISNDKKFADLKQENTVRCDEHKKELAAKFKEIDKDTEVMTFFGKHPKILKTIGIAVLIVLVYSLGNTKFIELILK